jgi:hypothetical protein
MHLPPYIIDESLFCTYSRARLTCSVHVLLIYDLRHFRSDDDDYDIDFYTVSPVAQDAADTAGTHPSPREQLEVT